MTTNHLLIELGTEELPPKALLSLSNAFTQGITQGLTDAKLSFGDVSSFASPRRLAVIIRDVQIRQDDQAELRKGPALKAAYDGDGNPTKAVQGFARSCGVAVEELQQQETEKGTWLVFNRTVEGQPIESLLQGIIANSLAKLPTPKRMRWGSSEIEFVRPAHTLIVMLGDQVVEAEILGIQSSRTSTGHRFHHPELVEIQSVDSYEQQLMDAYVLADYSVRRDKVRSEAENAAQELGGQVVIDPDLLDEVTALVEWPVAVVGGFEERYLAVPQECLITTMEDNQKYFAVLDQSGAIMPHFITTSNIESKDVAKVSEGNERVIRPRFSDAEFFWEQDKQSPLISRREKTQSIVFQEKLGTLFAKTERVSALSSYIATQLNADTTKSIRAAELCKCDLTTDMVYEFTKLQGTMGRYYALNDGENPEVAQALEEQYRPRYAGDDIPTTMTGRILSLSDKLDTLMGIFAIGMKPTGTKDPFALRRAALGVLRIMIEAKLDLDLRDLLTKSASLYADEIKAADSIDVTFDYIMERLKSYYQDQGIGATITDAVADVNPTKPLDFEQRIKAVVAFSQLPDADALAAANKRISNILKKQESIQEGVNESLLVEAPEKALFEAVLAQEKTVSELFATGQYETALTSLATLRQVVDDFFDGVMVMADDESLKNNRLALLSQLRGLFLHVADLSRLQS